MLNTENKIESTIKEIEELHGLVERTKWNDLNREGFIFELNRSYVKLKDIYSELFEINKELSGLLEQNAPNIENFLEELRKELTILDSNIRMEKSKKLRVELINENEEINVPELYSSLQNKIMQLTLKGRYSSEKIRTFLRNRKTPLVKSGSTAKNLIEILEKKEDEITGLKKQNIELKRKSFLRGNKEKDISEIESELNERDKKLDIAIRETNSAMKTHLAQLDYVEGSFKHLKDKISFIEESHERFTKNALELIRELKKERDYARKMALEIENETLTLRSNYTRELLNIEDQKREFKEKLSKNYEDEIKKLKRELNEKNIAMTNILKLVDDQEKKIEKIKNKVDSNNQSIYE